jgi:hypothetical protein
MSDRFKFSNKIRASLLASLLLISFAIKLKEEIMGNMIPADMFHVERQVRASDGLRAYDLSAHVPEDTGLHYVKNGGPIRAYAIEGLKEGSPQYNERKKALEKELGQPVQERVLPIDGSYVRVFVTAADAEAIDAAKNRFVDQYEHRSKSDALYQRLTHIDNPISALWAQQRIRLQAQR